MTDVMKVRPPRFKPGPVDGVTLEHHVSVMFRDVLARMDPRYPNNDFSSGLVANGNSVTLGPAAYPVGRTASVAQLTNQITNQGTAQDQRFLPQVSAGNKLSAQNILALQSSVSGGTATVTVTPHNLQYGFGQLAYSAGTISGLTPNQRYYVYTQDPNYTGGVMSYLASQNGQVAIADNGRYYVGSIITNNVGNTYNVSAMTSANPIHVTLTTAHGWANNDQVTFAGLPGDFGTHLNGNTYLINVTGPSEFNIPVDGSTFTAYTSGGTCSRISATINGAGGAGAGGSYIP